MANARILIVEDESILALGIQHKLEGFGYGITAIASSGEEAVSMTKETRPDLVLMDIMLRGEMDGVEAASRIKEKFDIPIVYLTAYSDESTLERAKKTSPFGYLLKPFEPRELYTTIETAIYKHKMDKETRKRGMEHRAKTDNKSGAESIKPGTTGEDTPRAGYLESLSRIWEDTAHDIDDLMNDVIGNIYIAKTGVYQQTELLEEAERSCIKVKDLIQDFFASAEGEEEKYHTRLQDSRKGSKQK